MIDKPHDALAKAIFSKVEHATELFRTGLPAEIAEHIDFARLETRPASFIDDMLRDSAADLLYLAPYKGQELLLLLEHLSTVQRHAVLRTWRYTGSAWTDHLANNKAAGHLPALIPYVLHHSDRGWRAPTTIRECIAAPAHDPLDAFVPDFGFVLDDLSVQSDEALRSRDMAAAPKLALWALKTARNSEALKASIHGWAEVFRQAADRWDDLLLILRYTLDVCEVEAGYIRTFLAHALGPRAEEAYMTIGETLRDEGRREGRMEGRREGRMEGRREGRMEGRFEGRAEALRSTLLMLIQQRFGELPEDVVARIERADEGALQRWLERVIPSATLAELFAD